MEILNSMEIRRFDLHKDFADINTWYYNRKQEFLPIRFLAKIGFIVPGIGAGFLMQTDANVGILEPFISNPDAPKEQRDKALETILAALVEEATKLNYSAVFGFSTSKSMLGKALKQDFKVVETASVTVAKELN